MHKPALETLIAMYPTADQFIAASDIEVERALLRWIEDITNDPMRRMATREGFMTDLLGHGGYDYDTAKVAKIQKLVSRGWKALEDGGLIEEPDPDNGKNGYRVISDKGQLLNTEIDYKAAKIQAQFTREIFHPALPEAAWNAFRVGDYDTAVFEAFKNVEAAVRKKGNFADTEFGVKLMEKAFDPNNGPLSDMSATAGRRKSRRDLFAGAFGEIGNPKAHGDPTIADPLIAIEEMMVASLLLRIIANA